jgi:hypothetical protein
MAKTDSIPDSPAELAPFPVEQPNMNQTIFFQFHEKMTGSGMNFFQES